MEDDGQHVLISTERMKDALDLLDRFHQLSFADVRDIITVGVNNQKEKRMLFRAIDYALSLGIKFPHQIDALESRIRADISDSFQTIERPGGITAVGSMVFDRARGEMTWKVLEDGPHILASNFKEGQLGWISGNLGTGKTATGCSIMEQWIDMGNRALSNIKTATEDSYTYVRDAQAMLLEIADILDSPLPDYWLMIFDELYVSGWSKAEASTRKNKDLDGVARVIRKLGGNLIVIDQREASVPTTIQELASSRYYCHRVGGGVLTVDLRGPYRHFKMKIEDFPLTNLEFESKDFAFFPTTEVVDFDGLYQALAKVEPNGFPKAIRAFIRG